MRWKTFIIFLTFIIILLLFVWMFFPYKVNNFEFNSGPSNFSTPQQSIEDSQFYPRMRFPYRNISYKIDNDCTLQKKNEMERAFKIMENKTILSFYPVQSEEEISVHCSEKMKQANEYTFIAGEGGPTSIIRELNFTVILKGQILLIRSIKCDFPNVPIHELLHVLGFNHSHNENNIMYPTTHCGQKIGEDTISLINELYSYPNYADIIFLNASAHVHGRYLDLNFTVKNDGLIPAGDFKVEVFADNKKIKEISLKAINVGYGRSIKITNIAFNSLSVKNFKLIAETNFPELNKKNNEIILRLKNQK